MITIQRPEECMGCFACLNKCPQKCITMESDETGFWYPHVDHNQCIKCGLCLAVCPLKNKNPIKNEPVSYACFNRNETIRMDSSSGGVFSLVAEKILQNDGVVFGAGFNEDFSVSHYCVDNKMELERLRGSKYVQSRIGNVYNQVRGFLVQGKSVLFTGTPCQISGLKSFLDCSFDNLFCIDIICHGVPSPKVWKNYVAYQENRVGAKARRIAFRRKDGGWKRFSVSLSFDNDTEYLQPLDKDIYMNAFLEDVCLRPSCYACGFKSLHRESDITLADFWGVQYVLPEMDDDKGVSLVLVNSNTGSAMFDSVKNELVYEKVLLDEAVKFNSAATKSAKYNPKRAEFFKELDHLPFDQLVKKHCSVAVNVRFKRKTKAILVGVLRKMGLLESAKKFRNIKRSRK